MAGQVKKRERQQMLDSIGIEAICERMESGESQAEIARSLGMHPAQLCRWFDADPQRSARAKLARQRSAESWMDRGLAALEAIPDDGTNAQIAKAREIAQHCRKMAAIRNPREYGDRVTQEHTGEGGGPIETAITVRPQISREEWLRLHGGE